jgi:hypothetical protein
VEQRYVSKPEEHEAKITHEVQNNMI